MLRKIIISLFILSTYINNSHAMVSFQLEGISFINSLKVENNLMLIENNNRDFIILYNKTREVIYLKHKNLDKTYKIALSKIKRSNFLTTLKPEKAELDILGFNTNAYTVKFGGRDCAQIHASKDLQLNSTLSSVFALYKGFNYFTGQAMLNKNCQNMNIANSFDKAGFPLAISHYETQARAIKMQNSKKDMKQFLKESNLNTKKAQKPDLNLQYELMLSLLTEKQQEIFLADSKNKPINIKIKAIDNLLKGF